MRTRLKVAVFLLAALSAQAHAYVTSAIMEYTCDDQAGFFLNGSAILQRSGYAPFNFEVLSTSDGTLPLELFNSEGDNLLAVENYDTEGYRMSISYRFTVHNSDSDPITLWSDPGQAKMLHLSKDQADPPGWTLPTFDDSAWQPAVAATELTGPFDTLSGLRDPAFSSLLGSGFVPRLAHNFNMKCNTADHNLYRTHFRFPSKQSKILTLIQPGEAKAGQKVAVRMIPGPDTAEFSQFNVLAWLPAGLDFVSASEGSKFDPALRRIAWSFGKKNLDVGYAHMNVQSVLSAGGWGSVEKALGPFKPGKGRKQLNTPAALWNDGASFTAGHPGWFKMSPHGVDLTQWKPQILGVIFHTQTRLGGKDMGTKVDADSIRFNYSVDGSTNGALRNDVEVSRITTSDYWFDGYYDATEDRKWTWDDVAKLAVKYEAKARGNVDKNLMAGMSVTVKYFTPAKASPYFYAAVSDPRCDTLKVSAAVFRVGSKVLAADATDLPVNTQLCVVPTSTPAPTSTPIPVNVVSIPTPQPTNVPLPQNHFRLCCLNVNPAPFNYAGTFVSFSVKKDVDVVLNIYSSRTGKVVRQMKAGHFRAGDNQVFFNAVDDAGKILSPGDYLFEVEAQNGGIKETVNATFRMKK